MSNPITPFSAAPGTPESRGRSAREILAALEERFTRQRDGSTRYALQGVGCDGAVQVPEWNGVSCCDDCPPPSGLPVIASTLRNVPVRLSQDTPRPMRGTGGQPTLSAGGLRNSYHSCAEAIAARRAARRFADSKGNFWDWDGAYLGAEAPIARTSYPRYYAAAEDTGCRIESLVPAPVTVFIDDAVTLGTLSCPLGLIGAWPWFDSPGPAQSAGNWLALGAGTVDGCGTLKSDDVFLCLERKAIGDIDITGSIILVVRDAADLSNAAIKGFLLEPKLLDRPTVPSGGVGTYVAGGNNWHVSAAPDGSWWVHDAGNKELRRVEYRRGTGKVTLTEKVTLGSGGTAWDARTIAAQVE